MNNVMSGTTAPEKRYVDGTHNFLMKLEESGFPAKYSVDVLWAKEIDKIVRITIDKSVVIQGKTLESLDIDLTNKHCQSVMGNSAVSDVLEKHDPWFVLTGDIVDKIERGVYTLCVNELRPRLVSYPNADELLPHLIKTWNFAKDIGAEALILTRNLRHNDTFIEAILVDNKGKIIRAVDVRWLFHSKFKSSKHYELFKKQFYRAFKAYIDLGDYYIITPTEVKPDGVPPLAEPLEETNAESDLTEIKVPLLSVKHFPETAKESDLKGVIKQAGNVLDTPTLVKTVKQIVNQNVQDQDKHIALVNCFYTWDGQCDKDVITQGIFDRYKALNKPLVGISVERRTLNNVVICAIIEGEDTPVELLNFRRTGISLHDLDFFHQEELKFMEKWLFENFYH